MSLHCFREKEASITALAEKIVAVCAAALEHRPGFSLVLAGGSTPADLYTMLASPPWRDRIEWSKGHICFLVYGQAKEKIVEAVPADKNGRYPAALIQKNSVSWYLSGMECEYI